MPALVLEQCKLYTRNGAPVAYVSWARLSDSVALRYQQAPHQLMPSEWQCGDQVWLMDLIAPFGGAEDIVKDLRETVLPATTIYRLSPDATGAAHREVWLAQPPA